MYSPTIHIYKGYEIEKVTRKDYVVWDRQNGGWLVHTLTLKAAKAELDKLANK